MCIFGFSVILFGQYALFQNEAHTVYCVLKSSRLGFFLRLFFKLKREASFHDGLLSEIKPTRLLFKVLQYTVVVLSSAQTKTM